MDEPEPEQHLVISESMWQSLLITEDEKKYDSQRFRTTDKLVCVYIQRDAALDGYSLRRVRSDYPRIVQREICNQYEHFILTRALTCPECIPTLAFFALRSIRSRAPLVLPQRIPAFKDVPREVDLTSCSKESVAALIRELGEKIKTQFSPRAKLIDILGRPRGWRELQDQHLWLFPEVEQQRVHHVKRLRQEEEDRVRERHEAKEREAERLRLNVAKEHEEMLAQRRIEALRREAEEHTRRLRTQEEQQKVEQAKDEASQERLQRAAVWDQHHA